MANLHHAHAQVAGNSRLNRGRYRVFCGKAGEQIAVQILNRRRAIEQPSPDFAAVALLNGRFGVNVCNGQTLPQGKFAVIGKIPGHGLFDFQRAGVLALDAVGVVGIHAA